MLKTFSPVQEDKLGEQDKRGTRPQNLLPSHCLPQAEPLLLRTQCGPNPQSSTNHLEINNILIPLHTYIKIQ